MTSRIRTRRLPRLRPRRLTLRARLTLIHTGLLLAAGAVLLAATYALFVNQLGSSLQRVMVRGTLPELEARAGAGDDVGHTHIRTQDGDILTGPAAEQWLTDQQASLQEAAADSLLTQGVFALLVVGGLAVAIAWWVSGRVLSPLHRVTATAHRISQARTADLSLHERIQLAGPDDEVKELADAFDSMVARLDRSFAGQRRFVANASHELRTPLTVGRAMVEMAMHRPGASEEVRALGADLLALNARHEELITGLLDLASAENGPLDRQPVDLCDIVEHVVDVTAGEAARAGVTMSVEPAEAPTEGDALLLERLVVNLVENGIRHNHDGGWVRIRTSADADGVAVEVSNTGPRVPAYDVPALFEPFRRLGPDRVVVDRGVGLGLSIVDAIVRAHDGTVDAVAREGGGLVVTVRLPRAPEPAGASDVGR